MNPLRRKLLRYTGWIIGTFGVGQVLRLIVNVVLARLLAPEIFGVMAIVNSLRTGFELFTDVGIGQNIVQSKWGAEPDFYNTAWTVQVIRGVLLWLASIVAGPLVANFYEIPILGEIFPTLGLLFVIAGLSSTSIFVLQKQMLVAKRNIFEVFFELIAAFVFISVAIFNPTIWGLVLSNIIAAAMRAAGTHFISKDLGNRFLISRGHLVEIVKFGKWIFFASVAFFIATFIDRLYFGTVFPLALLGVYGVARTLADGLSLLASRLTAFIVFPYVSNSMDQPRSELRQKISSVRFGMILLAAVCIAAVASSSDFIIQLLYDRRYWDAEWMLPLLCIGSWFAILGNLNESVLLGFGKPAYPALANTVKLGFLVVGLPIALQYFGAAGAITVVMLSELLRYVPTSLGMYREKFGFGIQDLVATLTMLTVIVLFDMIRWTIGVPTLTEGLVGPLQ
jgi:O-antigen/teichoic acid export membrane protein